MSSIHNWPSTSEGYEPSLNSSELAQSIVDDLEHKTRIHHSREMVNRATDLCFKKCIGVPEDSLSKKAETCAAQCTSKYLAMLNAVFKQFESEAQAQTKRMSEE